MRAAAIDRTNVPIFVVGPGAVGLTLAIIARRAFPVGLLARRERRDVLSECSLSLCGAQVASFPVGHLPVYAIEEAPRVSGPADFWLTVKAHQLHAALTEIAPLLTKESVVTIFSNGLGIYAEGARLLAQRCTVLRALPSFGAYLQSPHEVVLAGELKIALAAPLEHHPIRDELAQRLGRVGASVACEDEVEQAEWRKARTNLIVNPLCALAQTANGALGSEAALTALLAPLLREIELVATHQGIDLPPLTPAEFLKLLAPHAENLNSMLIDLRAGRLTEIDAITGRFLAAAQAARIPTPLNRALYAAVRTMERGRKETARS